MIDLEHAHSKRLTSHMSNGNLSATHAFNNIVLKVKPGLSSRKDLATALLAYLMITRCCNYYTMWLAIIVINYIVIPYGWLFSRIDGGFGS